MRFLHLLAAAGAGAAAIDPPCHLLPDFYYHLRLL
jgi:hypothetical protein